MFYDLFGAITSLLSTYYFIRLNTNAWIVGLCASSLNACLYWQKGIYADMCLESFYFLSMCYGWYRWSNQQQTKQTQLKTLSTRHWFYLCIVGLVCFAIVHQLLTSLFHSDVAKLDALTTSLSLIAQWLMCYKVMATWIFWLITDALYALMYLHKDLPFHTLLMLIYIGMAIIGYLAWMKKYRSDDTSITLDVSAKLTD